MASNSFKVKNSLVLTPKDLSTLTSPEAGDLACDINDSNKIKRYDAASASWVEVGSGGGVGGVDIFFVQDFESASLSSFTQTGLVLSQTDPLKGKVSAVLNHQAGVSPTNDQSFKQIIPVDRKFRGQSMVLRLDSKSNASQGNLVINIYDETNAANLVSSEQLQLSDDVNGKKTSVSFTIPESCASLSYTITALPESGKVSRIDDIICELAVTSLLETSVEVPVVTAWQGYTPTFQGFGTPTNVEFEWRQVGENVEIRGKFTSGAPTAVEARVGLPAGLSSAGPSLIPSIRAEGAWFKGVSSTSHGGTVLIEPSVTYITFAADATFSGVASNSLQKANGNQMVGDTNLVSFFASVPCAGLSATSTKTIALTQSGLVQEADSSIRLDTANGYGSTNTAIPRFSNLRESYGSDVTYQDSATLGASFTINTTGTYSISYSASFSGSAHLGLSKNSSQLTTAIQNITAADRLIIECTDTTDRPGSVSWTGILNAGDIIRPHNQIFSFSTPANASFTITKEGSLKQLNVSSDQKITIPTSELRMEGASTRGSTATAIVRFDNIAKLRGDAFTVESDSVLGTRITMKKAGKLDVSTSIFSNAANQAHITRNQSNLTALSGIASEILSSEYSPGAGDVVSPAWSGFVNIGDIIRVNTSAAISALSSNNLNLSFQEQSVQVSVTNTLPQFSESDSSVRVDTANGYGFPATKIRRFSNVRDNIGTDIEYLDSATNGASFTVKSAGIYNISYSDYTSGTSIGITLNSTNLATNISTIILNSNNEALANTSTGATNNQNCSWSGYLNVGDVIRAHSDGLAATDNDAAKFTISKVGKPNVTGVDVTPFVNVPQPVSQVSTISQTATFGNVIITGNLSTSSGSGIYAYNSSTGVYTALKSAIINVSASFQHTAASTSLPTIRRNSVNLSLATSAAVADEWASASAEFQVSAGDTFDVFNLTASTTKAQRVTVSATALSDQILTAPETFSTDTASLQYASSSRYTLSTLSSAPVGTYITFTYAANTNTRTQTTTRPTQTDADMNANGMLIYTRAYNAASTAAQPAAIAIQIGKGLKGKSLDLYKSAGKVTSGSLDRTLYSSNTIEAGASFKEYNEITGILYVDFGFKSATANTSSEILFSDITTQTSGYLVINASKNPVLTGFGLNRVAARGVNTSGQSIPNNLPTIVTYDAAKTVDTNGALNNTTGIFTAPETGYYQVNGVINYAPFAVVSTVQLYLFKNNSATQYGYNNTLATATNFQYGCSITDIVFLAKGDTIDMRAYQNSGSARSLLVSSGSNFFSVIKVSV